MSQVFIMLVSHRPSHINGPIRQGEGDGPL